MALGEVTQPMLDCLNHVCARRAQLSEEDDADPQSSLADVMRLSSRNYAQYFQFADIPAVQGIQHKKSDPMIAREFARWKEASFGRWVDEAKAVARDHGVRWSARAMVGYAERSKEVEDEWSFALQISWDSGFRFKDRYGCWQHWEGKPSVVGETIDMYLREHRTHRTLGRHCGYP